MKPSFYTRVLCSCSFKSADTKHERGKERERREYRATFCSFVYECTILSFSFFCISYIIYTQTNGESSLKRRRDNTTVRKRDIMQSQFKREHSRGNAHFIRIETLLFLAFIFKRVSSFWCLAALRTNTLGGSESVRFEYILLAFSDVPIFRNFVVPCALR